MSSGSPNRGAHVRGARGGATWVRKSSMGRQQQVHDRGSRGTVAHPKEELTELGEEELTGPTTASSRLQSSRTRQPLGRGARRAQVGGAPGAAAWGRRAHGANNDELAAMELGKRWRAVGEAELREEVARSR